jgi:hypothetical protein
MGSSTVKPTLLHALLNSLISTHFGAARILPVLFPDHLHIPTGQIRLQKISCLWQMFLDHSASKYTSYAQAIDCYGEG